MTWIKNVRLETGRNEIAPNVFKTETKEACLYVKGGLIKEITETLPKEAVHVLDAKGYLALPSLADYHVHLDKGHFGGSWQAVVPMAGVAERIKEEQGFLNDFLADTPQKAQALIDHITSRGATFLRVQVNVDPVIGLKNLELIKKVLEENKHKMDYEIVVFPQHGTLVTEERGLLSAALKDSEVTAIGGLDPATIDNDIEKSLTTVFNLAVKFNKNVDIHLHDRGTLGIFEINRIIDYTLKFNLRGKVAISHAFSLADVSGEELDNTLKRLKEAEISINTTVPIDTQALSIPKLKKHGIKVNVINDNINDHWSPFGSGDLIERARRAVEVFSLTDEVSLSDALGLVTNGVTPLDLDGTYQWPKVGDKANILFAKAECSAHLVARVCDERVVFFKGNLVSGEFK